LPRRVMSYNRISTENERLSVVIVEQEGINKEQLKKENRCSKKHSVLLSNGHLYEFKGN
jgi:hypothetical protein